VGFSTRRSSSAASRERALAPLPDRVAISVVTLGELELGVLAATDAEVRRGRSDTLDLARAADPLPITEAVARRFAGIVHDCRGAGARVRILDALIGAAAVEHGLPVVTQDDDFDAITAAHPALVVLRV